MPYDYDFSMNQGFHKKTITHKEKTIKSMNTKALIKAMQFLCLPTISLLVLIYLWFFDWGKFSAFVTSNDGAASFLRVVICLAEVILVYYMYTYYDKLIPNDNKNKKLYAGIENDKLKPFYSSEKRRGKRNFDLSYSDKEALADALPIDGDSDSRYTMEFCKVDDVINCVIIKVKKS